MTVSARTRYADGVWRFCCDIPLCGSGITAVTALGGGGRSRDPVGGEPRNAPRRLPVPEQNKQWLWVSIRIYLSPSPGCIYQIHTYIHIYIYYICLQITAEACTPVPARQGPPRRPRARTPGAGAARRSPGGGRSCRAARWLAAGTPPTARPPSSAKLPGRTVTNLSPSLSLPSSLPSLLSFSPSRSSPLPPLSAASPINIWQGFCLPSTESTWIPPTAPRLRPIRACQLHLGP